MSDRQRLVDQLILHEGLRLGYGLLGSQLRVEHSDSQHISRAVSTLDQIGLKADDNHVSWDVAEIGNDSVYGRAIIAHLPTISFQWHTKNRAAFRNRDVYIGDCARQSESFSSSSDSLNQLLTVKNLVAAGQLVDALLVPALCLSALWLVSIVARSVLRACAQVTVSVATALIVIELRQRFNCLTVPAETAV